MSSNIITYLRSGFKPITKSDKNVFFEKDMKNPLSKEEIRNYVKMVREGNLCLDNEKAFKARLKNNISLE